MALAGVLNIAEMNWFTFPVYKTYESGFKPVAGINSYNPSGGITSYNPTAKIQTYNPLGRIKSDNPIAGISNIIPNAH